MQKITGAKSSVLIRAVGDLCPGNYAVEGQGVGALTSRFGCDYPFAKLGNFSDSADILIANLEGVLSERCRKESLRFGGVPEMADAIRAAGFNIVSLANNHAFEHGADILQESIAFCTKAGLEICGLRGKGAYYCQPVYVTKEEITLGLLAYNWVGLEEQVDATQHLAMIDDGVVNYTWCRDRGKDLSNRRAIKKRNKHVIHDVSMLKEEVDIVVLLPHWGYEWTIYPPFGVLQEAKVFIDAGVDLIIGSHPHVAQGIEQYNGKTIAYSLGNFLFDPQPEKYFDGMIFDCAITKDGSQQYDYSAMRCDDRCQPKIAPDVVQKSFRKIIENSTKAILSEKAENELDDDLIYKKFEKGYNRRKVHKIKYLLLSMIKHPGMIIPVCKKILSLVQILSLRLRGQRVRW